MTAEIVLLLPIKFFPFYKNEHPCRLGKGVTGRGDHLCDRGLIAFHESKAESAAGCLCHQTDVCILDHLSGLFGKSWATALEVFVNFFSLFLVELSIMLVEQVLDSRICPTTRSDHYLKVSGVKLPHVVFSYDTLSACSG